MKVRDGRLRVCLAASAGGHMSQLMKLQEGWVDHEVFFVTTTEVVREKLSETGRVYVVGECNRQHPVEVFKVLCRCVRVVLKERPDVVISTGAAAGCLMCFSGKFFGGRVIWLDSITNVERLSLSGRIVRYFADMFFVQWSGLTKRYKNTEYVGVVI